MPSRNRRERVPYLYVGVQGNDHNGDTQIMSVILRRMNESDRALWADRIDAQRLLSRLYPYEEIRGIEVMDQVSLFVNYPPYEYWGDAMSPWEHDFYASGDFGAEHIGWLRGYDLGMDHPVATPYGRVDIDAHTASLIEDPALKKSLPCIVGPEVIYWTEPDMESTEFFIPAVVPEELVELFGPWPPTERNLERL